MNAAQLARIKEYQSDFCALVDADFLNPQFVNWDDQYRCYVKYGTPDQDSRGADRPPHKPPTP